MAKPDKDPKEQGKKAGKKVVDDAVNAACKKNPSNPICGGGGGSGSGSGSGGGSGGCFVKGTLVATPHGRIPIEQIKAATEVYSYDWDSGKLVGQSVLNVTETMEQEILILNFGNEGIRCTPLHRFYTGQWVPAKKLKSGDRVLSQNGQWKVLHDIQREIQNQPVYNLCLIELHNYLVGQAGLIVHNEKNAFYEDTSSSWGWWF